MNLDPTDWQAFAVDLLQTWGWKVAAATAILVVGLAAASVVTRLAKRGLRRSGRLDETLVRFVGGLVGIGLKTFVVIAAIQAVGIATTSFVAVIGAAGLAVGLALQGTLSHFASGVMLIFFRPFSEGDFVEAGGSMGTVKEVGLVHTVLTTPDAKRIVVPNGQVFSNTITNFSSEPVRRVDMVFGIGYDDDMAKARSVLAKLLADEERVLDDPEPVIVVGNLGDCSVDFYVRPWVNRDDYWPVYWDLQERVKQAFDAEGISIPFPQRDVHLYREAPTA